MKVTNVNISHIRPTKGLVAFAKVEIEGQICLGFIGIHKKRAGGFRLTYPQKRTTYGRKYVCFPITPIASQIIENAVISAYEESCNQSCHAGYDYT